MHLKKNINKTIIKKFALIKKAKFYGANFQTTYSCSLKKHYDEIEFNKAKNKVEQRNNKKKKLTSAILLVVNLIIISGIFVYYGLTSGIESPGNLLQLNIDYKYLILAVVALIVVNFIDSFRFAQLTYKTIGKFKLFLGFKTHITGKYYDNITPFAVGGQPFQIFYLNKKGLPADKATSIPLAKALFTNIAFSLLSIIVVVLNIFLHITTSPVIIVISIIGFIANAGLIFLIILLSTSKRVGPILVIKVLKLLNKLKIIKNYKKTFFKVSRFVKNYQKVFISYAKSIWTVISQVVLAIITYIATYLIVYFIYLAFLPESGSLSTLSYFHIFCSMILCELCTSIMPLPGGTGMAEISFDALLKNWFSVTLFPWALLIWRILTYFVYIIGGILKMIISFLCSAFKKQINKNVSKTN